MGDWIWKYETYVEKMLEKYKVPGTAIGVAKDGDVIFQKGIGYRNVEKELPITEETIFGIASITKSFTAVAVMQLQEAGKLSVNDAVIKYLPEFKTPNDVHTKMVTIHHLLTHTSGLPPLYTIYHAMARTMMEDSSVTEEQKTKIKEHPPIDNYDELLKFLGELNYDLLGKPGTQFSYSNDCYALLGAIIERVSGIAYDEYITENLLKPVGMTSSTFDIELVLQSENVTELYATKDEEGETEVYAVPGWWDSKVMFAGGFIRSTLKDMLLYTKVFLSEGLAGDVRILNPDSIKEMMHPHVQINEHKYYGYGLGITPNYNGGTLVEHSGGLKGVSSHMSIVPEKGLAGVTLTNLGGVPAGVFMLGALNCVQDLEPETPLVTYSDFPVSQEELDKYVGDFKSGEGAEMSISKEKEKLIFTSQGKNHPMRPVGKHQFTIYMSETETPIRFLFDKTDIYGLSLGSRQVLKTKAEKLQSS